MLISAVQQGDSVIHLYTFFFIFFSVMVYHRILNIVPCEQGYTYICSSHYFSVLRGIYPEMELLDHMVTLCLIF